MTEKKANELNMQNRKTYREQPRICMPSGRNFCRETFLCGHYEAQDVLVEVDDVDLVCLDPGHNFKERWQVRLMYRDISGRGVFANPGLNKVRLTREYDLFVARCQTEKDLPHINAIEGLKERSLQEQRLLNRRIVDGSNPAS